jgi:hypothetical protein
LNLDYLGDALDHWKGSLFEFLHVRHILRDFAVDPMASDAHLWTETDFELLARLMRINKTQILRHGAQLTERALYFDEINHSGDLFLDPDTGIQTSGNGHATKYVKPGELAGLLRKEPNRIVAVYQHVRAQRTAERVDGCLQALALVAADFGWCSYEAGTVAMLFLSQDKDRTNAVADGFRGLLGRHADGRVRDDVTHAA